MPDLTVSTLVVTKCEIGKTLNHRKWKKRFTCPMGEYTEATAGIESRRRVSTYIDMLLQK